jgi:hypothetical protein
MKKKETDGILLVTGSILVLIDVSILLLNLHGNKWIVIICLVPLIIHIILYHTIYRHKKYISGLNHIIIFRNVFYLIFIIMIIIGFTSLVLCSSVCLFFFQNEIQSDNQTLFGEMLLEFDQTNFIENKMKACN